MDCTGKKVLVTGGSRGIGRAACLLFAAQGAAVAIGCNKNRASADALAEEIRARGGAAFVVQGDVSTPEGAERIVDAAAEALDGLDTLVCAAGTLTKSPFTEVTKEHFDREINTNFAGAFFAAQRAVERMRRQGGGSIVLLSSQAAFTGSAGGTVYSATKGALLSLTYALARELAPENIRVNCVSPGRIETDMVAYASPEKRRKWLAEIPMGRLGTPEETATAIVYFASDAAAYITGANLNVGGGVYMG